MSILKNRFFSVFKPATNITVSEWAEQFRFIAPHKSAESGRWHNEKTPYLKKIMDAFSDINIEKIVFCSATQVGKTQAILNMLGYVIDNDPAPVMIVYPTEDVGRDIFRDFIDPMIRSCPTLKEKIPNASADYTLSRMAFKGGATVFLAWANSPASLASKPIRFLFLDEVDKYPVNVGKEASPIELAIERTSTFWNRKIVMVSTPTTEDGHIWSNLEHVDVKYTFKVPCPYCGHYQELKFEQVKWKSKTNSFVEAENTAFYECEKCGKPIHDHQKQSMLNRGKWVANRNIKEYKTVGFHLNGLYSPWRTFGQFARKFLESKNQPEKLQNFVNSWLAEPWRDDSARITQEESINALKLYEVNKQGVVPRDAVALTAGVDVQEDRFYFVVRAWAADYTSWLVLEGIVEDWDALADTLVFKKFTVEGGGSMEINLINIDSGYRTKEVYRFVERFYPKTRSVKGASTDLRGRSFALPSSEAKRQLGVAAPFLINTLYYKDFLYMRRRIPAGEKGAFYLYEGVSEDYLRQITSEIRTTKNGKVIWKPRSERMANHLWDAEVYAAAAADMVGLQYSGVSRHGITKKRKPVKSSWIGG